MGFFDTDNSVEAAAPSRSRARAAAEDVPVREATAAELAGAAQRRARAERDAAEQPAVRAAAPQRGGKPAEAEEDAIAKRHGLYTTDRGKTRTYFADYQQKREVMRADPARIRTKHDDRQTVTAVLDLAQARGWDTLRLRGSEDFRREAWVQAGVRGIATEGYKPTETDRQELTRRQAALKPAAAAAESAPAAARPVPVRAATPQQAWSAVEKQGEQARASDAAKQGQGEQKTAKQAPAQSPAPKAAKAARRAAGAAPKPADAPAVKPPAEDHVRFYSQGKESTTLTTDARQVAQGEAVHYVDVPKAALGGLTLKPGSETEFMVDDKAIVAGLKPLAVKADQAAASPAGAWKAKEEEGTRLRAQDAAATPSQKAAAQTPTQAPQQAA